MRILLLALNYRPEIIGTGVYSTGLAEALVRKGHEVHAVVAKPYYPAWRITEDFRGGWKESREAGVSVVRCPLYVPSKPTGAKRILHHLSFAASALWPMLTAARQFSPDLVVTVAPSLIAAPVAFLASRIAGCPAWLHVQDFEVDAAFATGQIGSTAAGLARTFERGIIRSFDCVSSISPEMCRKLTGMGVEPVTEFRNWADLDRVYPLTKPSPYRAEWGITAKHVALYSGNIANKQGIEIVAEAAKRLQGRTDIQFVVCGEGPNRDRLQSLPNLMVRDLQPVERLGELLGLATVHLLPQKAGAADLVLPSKLTNMLASGRPVVATAADGTGLAREIDGCGLVTPPGDAAAFAEAIVRLVDDPALWQTTAQAARGRAETVWSGSLARVIARMEEVCCQQRVARPLPQSL